MCVAHVTHPLGLTSRNIFLMEGKVGRFSGDSSQHALTMTIIFSLPFSSDKEGRSGTKAVGSLI